MSGRAGRLRSDVLSNVVAQLAAALVPLITVPVLLRTFGLGAYGFIGLLSVLAVSMTLLTRGLGWALQREIAASQADPLASETAARSARTYERFSWSIGVALALLSLALSGWLAGVLEGGSLSRSTMQSGLVLLGVKVAALLPYATYQAVLFGAGKQVRANIIATTSLLLTGAVSLNVAVFTRSVTAYLAADTAGWLLTTALFGGAAHRLLRRSKGSRLLHRSELRERAGLAGGLVWTHGTGLILGQTDRLAVGTLQPLDALGAYTPASTAARALSLTYAPVLASTYPRLCRFAAEGAAGALSRVNRLTTTITAWSSGCAAATLALFAHDVLHLWTGSREVADRAAGALAICAAAGVLLAQVDAFLQLHSAWGTSGVAVRNNGAALFWLPPVALVLVAYDGLIGAALSWLAYTAVSWVVFLVASERRLPGTAITHLRSFIPPVAVTTACAGLARLTVHVLGFTGWTRLLVGATLSALLSGLAFYVAPGGRRGMRELFSGGGLDAPPATVGSSSHTQPHQDP